MRGCVCEAGGRGSRGGRVVLEGCLCCVRGVCRRSLPV